VTPLSPWNAKGGKPFEVVNNVYGDAERRRRLSEPASSSWPPKSSGAISRRDRFRWVPFSGPTGAGEPTQTLSAQAHREGPSGGVGVLRNDISCLWLLVNDGHRNGHWAASRHWTFE
jgi:hypothetical protein